MLHMFNKIHTRTFKPMVISNDKLIGLNHLFQIDCVMVKNFEVFIVPMNAQNSDALSLNPDVVLVNYIRENNLEILNLYKNRGIKVAILDTEGVGKW